MTDTARHVFESQRTELDVARQRFIYRLATQSPLLERQYRDAITAVVPQQDGTLAGVEASAAMGQATLDLVDLAHAIADEMTDFRWLQYLRWVPGPLLCQPGLHPASFSEAQVVSEVLSTFRNPERLSLLPASHLAVPPMPTRQVQAVARLLALGRLLRHLRVAWRMGAKGVPLRLAPGEVPLPDESSDAYRAVRLLDERQASADGANSLVGTVSYVPEEDVRGLRIASGVVTFHPTPGGGHGDRWSYQPRFVQLRLSPLLRERDWWQPDLPKMIFIAQLIAGKFALADDYERLAIGQDGYSVWPESHLRDLLASELADESWRVLDEHFHGFRVADLTPDDLFGMLSEPGTIMPLRAGPILRPMGDGAVCLDHLAITQRIWTLQSPLPNPEQSPDAVLIRATDFEVQAQRLIDRTRWAPVAAVRNLVGSKPKLSSGEEITDLDAIASRGDTCLLINCKSYVSGDYGEGSYNIIRNIITRLGEDYTKWTDTVGRVISDARGHALLRQFRNIVPVILTPAPHYLPLVLANQQALEGLPAIVSLEELLTYLDRADQSA